MCVLSHYFMLYCTFVSRVWLVRVWYVFGVYFFECMYGSGKGTSACKGAQGLFSAEDYDTVIRGDVSASRCAVVRSNMYSCCAMCVCV